MSIWAMKFPLIFLILFQSLFFLKAQSTAMPLFRIQIGTAAKMPDENSKFKKDFAEAEGVRLDDGMIRVYVGTFETYHEAKEKLAAVKEKGYETAYVVAFYKGKRISVDEAITIIYGD